MSVSTMMRGLDDLESGIDCWSFDLLCGCSCADTETHASRLAKKKATDRIGVPSLAGGFLYFK